MVEVVELAPFLMEILNISPGIQVSLKHLHIIFNVFGLVSNGNVECAVSFTENKRVDPVGHTCFID